MVMVNNNNINSYYVISENLLQLNVDLKSIMVLMFLLFTEHKKINERYFVMYWVIQVFGMASFLSLYRDFKVII